MQGNGVYLRQQILNAGLFTGLLQAKGCCEISLEHLPPLEENGGDTLRGMFGEWKSGSYGLVKGGKMKKEIKQKHIKGEKYKLLWEDTVALVLGTQDDWKTCCITEYRKNGNWMCGMNLITSLDIALRTAEKYKLNIIFESMLRKKESSNDPHRTPKSQAQSKA